MKRRLLVSVHEETSVRNNVKLVCTGLEDSKEGLRRRGYPETTSLMSPIPSRETLFGSLLIYFFCILIWRSSLLHIRRSWVFGGTNACL